MAHRNLHRVLQFLLVFGSAFYTSSEKLSYTRNVKPFKINQGPVVKASKGEPWPKPQLHFNYEESFMILRPAVFRFEIVAENCDMIEDAFKRYYAIIFKTNNLNLNILHSHQNTGNASKFHGSHLEWKGHKDFHGYLDILKVHLLAPCEKWPGDEMDESYEIKIDSPDSPEAGLIAAPSNWGILRALETFSQLLHATEDFTALRVKSTLLLDYPRFPYRSVMLDTSRHFLSKKIILQNLDLMAMNKFNVFHWHIVDDQSFPYESAKFPELSIKGAFRQYTHVYTRNDVRDIIEYARLRGIRVIPEFDTPGHTASWGTSQVNLLTTCYNTTTGEPNGNYGPIDPTKNVNFEFLKSFFEEVAETFPDKYMHLGGDEVDKDCWESNPKVQEFMKMMNYSQDYNLLEEFYMQKLVDIVRAFPQNKSYVVWQEVFDDNVNMDPSTIIHVWKSKNFNQELYNVTNKGYRALLSSCWYLNYISYGSDWRDYYECDPQNFNATFQQKRLVMGGGPAIWGEMVDSTNLIPRLWPRAAAPAERLWSSIYVNDTNAAASRLEEHRCRLLKRGFLVEPPNGPGFCDVNWEDI